MSALASVLLLTGVISGSALVPAAPAAAVTGTAFDPSYVISDSLFYDSRAMSASQIQSFLNGSIGSCRNAMCLNVASVSYPSVSRQTSRRTGNIICEAISGGSMLVSEWIYRVQVACGISAKVILVTLQKEQALTTSQSPSTSALKHAMGMACPDTAPCDSAFEGLATQIYEGSLQLKAYKASAFARQPGTHFIQWNPDTSCGGTYLDIKNYATAALYNYTPYQPNSAALGNLYGTGDGCSSYGNRNFWRLYNDWFGATTYSLTGPIGTYYANLVNAAVLLGYPIADQVCGLRDSGCSQKFGNGMVHYSPASGAHRTDGEIQVLWRTLGFEGGALGYPITDASQSKGSGGSGYVQQFQSGAIQWTATYRAVAVLTGPIRSTYITEGYQNGWLGWPKSQQESKTGGVAQSFEGGYLYAKTGATTAIPVSDAIRLALAKVGGLDAMGWPTAKEACSTGTCAQQFERGTVTADGGSATYPVGPDILSMWLANSSELGAPRGYYQYSTVNGGGNVQQFERGAIQWTPRNGAVAVLDGPIRSEYVAQGWQAGSLGWPKIGRVCDATTCQQEFDNGIIAIALGGTRAYRVDGGILAAWKTGYVDLGAPQSNTSYSSPNGGGYVQQFQEGAIHWTSRNSGIAVLEGPIRTQYVVQGWQAGSLGWPKTNRVCDSTVCQQDFDSGSIVQVLKSNSAYRVDGEILTMWKANASDLGAPLSNAAYSAPNGSGYVQQFERGAIQWSSRNRAVVLLDGPIRSQYVAEGWQTGTLGWPKANRVCDSEICLQEFDNGVIALAVGAPSAYRLDGEILAAWRATTSLGAPLGNAANVIGSDFLQPFAGGTITWDPVNRAVVRLS